MFGKLAKHLNYPHSPDKLLENTLSGYFIPFRSARYNDLPYKKDALQFAFNLWEEILRTITPRLIMCIDKEAYKCLKVLIEDAYGIPMIEAYQLDTGWVTVHVFNVATPSNARWLSLAAPLRFLSSRAHAVSLVPSHGMALKKNNFFFKWLLTCKRCHVIVR